MHKIDTNNLALRVRVNSRRVKGLLAERCRILNKSINRHINDLIVRDLSRSVKDYIINLNEYEEDPGFRKGRKAQRECLNRVARGEYRGERVVGVSGSDGGEVKEEVIA